VAKLIGGGNVEVTSARGFEGVVGLISIKASRQQKTKRSRLRLTFLSTGHRLGDKNGVEKWKVVVCLSKNCLATNFSLHQNMLGSACK
jgi:hypothetical protein